MLTNVVIDVFVNIVLLAVVKFNLSLAKVPVVKPVTPPVEPLATAPSATLIWSTTVAEAVRFTASLPDDKAWTVVSHDPPTPSE